ncbi:hypothetical protein LP420_35375 [Massilia sp. B-10]|nr:hypothetical protein LP420_35375 [Massilia sp. B-10]
MLASAALPPFQDKAAVRQWSAQTDRMIVKYKEGAWQPASAVGPGRAAGGHHAAQPDQQFGLRTALLHTTGTGAHVIQLDRKQSLDQVRALAAELKARDPSVEYAEPDRMMHKLAVPTDPRYRDQWHYFSSGQPAP